MKMLKRFDRMNRPIFDVPSAFAEKLSDVLFGCAKELGKFPISCPSIIESLCPCKVDRWRVMLSTVLHRTQQFQIFNAVIQYIAVDVVDVLKALKFAPKMLSHQPSMFENSFSFDIDQLVSVRAFHFDRLACTREGLK